MNNYLCPMHPEVQQEDPGRCPKCGMKLVAESEAAKKMSNDTSSNLQSSYKPLVIIIGFIFLVTGVLGARDLYGGFFFWQKVMSYFMAGFFLVFSGFKLLDLKGFAEGYSTYDLLAKRVFVFGYVYPFIELTLGLLYLLRITPLPVTLATFIVMAFSGIGVAIKISKHEKFQCACLGTFLRVPLTKVTLIEDFGMAAMAFLMVLMK